MFGWFKKKPAVDANQKERFMRHIEKAEGSPFVRSMIAEVMCSIEEPAVAKERDTRPLGGRLDFMVTCECFITYSLKIGAERVLGPGTFQQVLAPLGIHLIKHAEFFPDTFLSVWTSLDEYVLSPPAGGEDKPDEPIGRLMVAAFSNKTLFPNGHSPASEFQMHLSFDLQATCSFAEKTAAAMRGGNML